MSDLVMPRRKFLAASLGFIACAPAIVRASSLMPVKAWVETGPTYEKDFLHLVDPLGWRIPLTHDTSADLFATMSRAMAPHRLSSTAGARFICSRGMHRALETQVIRDKAVLLFTEQRPYVEPFDVYFRGIPVEVVG